MDCVSNHRRMAIGITNPPCARRCSWNRHKYFVGVTKVCVGRHKCLFGFRDLEWFQYKRHLECAGVAVVVAVLAAATVVLMVLQLVTVRGRMDSTTCDCAITVVFAGHDRVVFAFPNTVWPARAVALSRRR